MKYSSVTGKNWELKEVDNKKVLQLTEQFSISYILSKLLALRKIKPEKVESFLNPKIKNIIPNPNILKDMDIAVSYILNIILENKTIGIFGDYDVDGASATALLINFFKKINQRYTFFIPDREKDGYGPSINSFDKLIKKKIDTIITVDCGSTSYDAIDFAKNKCIETIVLDHHQIDVKLPKAKALINPSRIDDVSNLDNLCATSITFLFLIALNKSLKEINWYNKNQISEPDLFAFLDLVALATVCDVVPLLDLNRAFVKQGLRVIEKRMNLGLKKLIDNSEIFTKITSYDLGFLIGPKINAGGRLGFSSYGSELLSANDESTAEVLSIKLNQLNEKRKKIEKIHLDEIYLEAEKHKKDPVLVLYKPDWHEGIIGIIASRIKDKFYKPTIIITGLKNTLKASARSVFGFNIGSLIQICLKKKIILKGGGHKMAAGFIIEKDKIPILRNYLIDSFNKVMFEKNFENKIFIDSKITCTSLTENFYDELESISPFGHGNNNPCFILENVRNIKSNIIKNKHIRTILGTKDGNKVTGICFNAIGTELESHLLGNKKNYYNIVGNLSLNHWKGKKKIDFIIKDIAINQKVS